MGKDDMKGSILEETVGLTSNLYVLHCQPKDQCANRIVKSLSKTLTLDDYNDCFLSGEAFCSTKNLIVNFCVIFNIFCIFIIITINVCQDVFLIVFHFPNCVYKKLERKRLFK